MAYKLKSVTVKEIGSTEFVGDMIPPEWFNYIRYDFKTKHNGKILKKPYLLAILILSNIIYWYKPTKDRDEETGKPKAPEQKFKADKLQKSYRDWAELYGVSADQIADACRFLERKGLITIEHRTIPDYKNKGKFLNNVTFIEPVVEAIKKITHPDISEYEKPDIQEGVLSEEISSDLNCQLTTEDEKAQTSIDAYPTRQMTIQVQRPETSIDTEPTRQLTGTYTKTTTKIISDPTKIIPNNINPPLPYGKKEKSLHSQLMDYISQYRNGMLTGGMEGKAAKELVKYIESNNCTFQDVKDCMEWIVKNKPKYLKSLASVKSLMFDYLEDKKSGWQHTKPTSKFETTEQRKDRMYKETDSNRVADKAFQMLQQRKLDK